MRLIYDFDCQNCFLKYFKDKAQELCILSPFNFLFQF